jgi:hypothetical protein
MKNVLLQMRQQANHARYRSGQQAGHYESFFLRANHPNRPLAFWIRYTLFSPNRRPENALGELWAVFFDGGTHQHVAVKQEFPIAQCVFNTSAFFVRVGDACLEPGKLNGTIASGDHRIAWNLTSNGDAEPLLLLPLDFYDAAFPKAKSLVGLPMVAFNGSVSIDGNEIAIVNWVGSQNHNWGAKHTDLYAWGQVAGFDNHPDSFLEVATARLKIGPLWTPAMTPIVLRHRGEEIALNNLMQTLRARGSFRYFEWQFRSETQDALLEGKIAAPREAFVGLNYYNPPGGTKHCLNTKIASCELKVVRTRNGGTDPPEILTTQHRAAFEILTDDRGHGVEIRA